MEQIILKNNAISIMGKLLFPSGSELFRLYRYGPIADCLLAEKITFFLVSHITLKVF